MEITINFKCDNDAFGQGDTDDQFGYHVATILKSIANDFSGNNRREVGTGGVTSTIYDGNGNNVGTVTVEGYEPAKKTLEDWWDNTAVDEALECLAEHYPDLPVPLSTVVNARRLLDYIKFSIGAGTMSVDVIVGNDIK